LKYEIKKYSYLIIGHGRKSPIVGNMLNIILICDFPNDVAKGWVWGATVTHTYFCEKLRKFGGKYEENSINTS
jgi:hypothetical protein